MPQCPVENSAADPAEWKEYRPRGPDSTGSGTQEDLVVIKGTRAGLMERLKKIYGLWLPHHQWIKRWNDHQRKLTYATFSVDEACVMTDFSAIYDHKAFCARCCEQPHHSNMDVFVITWARIEAGQRKLSTEVVRVISEAKGNAHFHNEALKLIANYLKTVVPSLKCIFVFTDGCKAQYKGRKNFGRIAQFPSQHEGVRIHHRFSASHHFKGPHDGYGKDFKLLSKTAERNKKRRMPTTFDWYRFGAEMMAQPLKKARRTVREVVDDMPLDPDAVAFHAAAAAYVAARRAAAGGAGGDAPQRTCAAGSSNGVGAPHRIKRRAKRKRTVIEIDEGNEAEGIEGRTREESRSEVDGIFSAIKYHWLLFCLPSPGLKVVPWGQICEPGECHAILDEKEEGDANEVKGSDSMYEFAAINPRIEEAELYTKCFPCDCPTCRGSTTVSTEFDACPNISQTGRWRRVACHRTRGLVARASKKRDNVAVFARTIKAGSLYAAAGDPKSLERGGRPYWLLRTAGTARKLSSKVRAFEDPKAPTFRTGTWVVRAQWYLSTADDVRARRQSYKLIPEYHYVAVSTMVQESGLQFIHASRDSSSAESTFGEDEHDRIMAHNFGTYY